MSPTPTLAPTLSSRPLSAPPQSRSQQAQSGSEPTRTASEGPYTRRSSVGPPSPRDEIKRPLESTIKPLNGHWSPVAGSNLNANFLSPMVSGHTTNPPREFEIPSNSSLRGPGSNVELKIASEPLDQRSPAVGADQIEDSSIQPTDCSGPASNDSWSLTVGPSGRVNLPRHSLDCNLLPYSQVRDSDLALSTLASYTTSIASTPPSSPLAPNALDRILGGSEQNSDLLVSTHPSDSSSDFLQPTIAVNHIDLHNSKLSDSISGSSHLTDLGLSLLNPIIHNLDCNTVAGTETTMSTNISSSKKKKKLKKKKKNSTAQTTSPEIVNDNVCSQMTAINELCTLSTTDPSSNHHIPEPKLNPSSESESVFF